MKKRKGFTLVELLVVVSIIAILSTVVVVSYSGVIKKVRDSKRRSDLLQIGKAIDAYTLTDDEDYPESDGWIAQVPDGDPATQSQLANALTPKYLASLPCDPSYPNCSAGDTKYIHVGPTGWCSTGYPGVVKKYRLYAKMEGQGNITTPDAVDTCVGRGMNYRIGD